MTIIHSHCSQQRTVTGENWRRATGTQSELRSQLDVISPVRIAGDVCRKHRFTGVSSAPTGADTRTDADAIHDAVIFRGQTRRRSVAQALRVFVEDQHSAHHSVT